MSVIGGSRGRAKLDYDPGNPNMTNFVENASLVSYSGDNGTKATVVADADGADTGITITMDGTDNDCETVYRSGEKIDPNDTMSEFGFEAIIQVTEADEGDASIFVGLSDITGATLLSDAGAMASGDHVGFHVLGANESGGSAFWRTVVQNAATNDGETTTTAYAAATEYRLRAEGRVFADGITVKFYVDGVLVSTVTGAAVSGFGEMHPFVAGITTNGTNADVLAVKFFTSWGFKAA